MKKRQLFSFVFILIAAFSSAQIFTWKNPNLPTDSLKKDSILAAKISREIFEKDTADFVKQGGKIIIEEAALAKTDRSKILGDLNAKGAIIRGITFGNNQGSSAQSSMDLQISGKLSKDISVLASITDHNLPIQADGYTQSLEEFDKIFIQLGIRQNTFLTGGHIDLDDNSTFFGRYQRRSMGLQFRTKFGTENNTDFNISAGVARSEFHRIRFQGLEGNLGPYRLTGRNGENFITVIPGSEQVFIDGMLMKRGEKQDYNINYNTGEVTFTSYRPIYRQNFITISYNYTNRNYSRYLVTGGISHKNERWKLGLNWFLENDNKNAPLSLNLSKEDEEILAKAGNNPELMLAPSGIREDYGVNKILYRKVSDGGGHYEYSTNPNETLYQVAFTYFGSGRGDYRLKQTTNNGRIFEYAGAGLGDYSAVRKLPSPEKSQVISANAEFLLKNGRIGTDVSLSNYDRNLFSSINNEENIGYAAQIFGDKLFQNEEWKSTVKTEYQHIDRRFHILDRINSVEFSRDFNLAQEFSNRTQDRLVLSFLNEWKNKSWLNYYGNFLNEKGFYRGIKNDLDFGWRKKSVMTTGSASYLDTKSDFQNTNFTRAKVFTGYQGKKGSWGVGGLLEHNVKKFNQNNAFDATSYSWKEVFAQKKIGDSARTKLFAKAYFRDNDSVRNNRLANVNHILGFMAESEIIKNDRTQLSILAHYRKFFYQDDMVPEGNQDFLIGNLNYTQKFLRNGLRLQAFYELGNGQEPQREFQYIKVTDGQGVYKWTDYNGDGVQQLDEFEVAEYIDLAQYIRIYTNTLHYLPSNKNKLQASLFLNPATAFNSENAFLKRWNFNFSLFAQNSFFKKNRVLMWNPFDKEADQILKNQNFIAGAQFNPTSRSGWNGSYNFTATNNLINANYSREETARNSHSLTVGYQISQDFQVNWENILANQHNRSELFSARNFVLNSMETKPKATYKLSNTLLAELGAAYRHRKRVDGAELLKAAELGGTLQWDRKKTSIRGGFSFINNDFSGESFSIVGNQMLDGLKPGKNEIWNLYIQQALNSFINLNISYEGRNSGEKTIHVGSMQLKASF